MLMNLRVPALSLMLMTAASCGVRADTPDDARGRYALSPVDGGVLRLDKETGAVALCAKKGEAWSCDPVSDKAGAANERIAKLEAENKELKDRIAALEAGRHDGPAPDAATPDGKAPGFQVPSEEEVDKALDYVERMFRKFRDRLQKLDPPKSDKPADGMGGGKQL